MAFWTDLPLQQKSFTDPGKAAAYMEKACRMSDQCRWVEIGKSEENRPIFGAILGNGPMKVSLIAGSHSDEPVGPETLRLLVSNVGILEKNSPELFEHYTFLIIPHINPDGEARNREWIKRWPDMNHFAQHVLRELPGRDLEFGYPDMRIENKVVSNFIKKHGPVDLHMSLHGMAFAEGCMLLIEPHWIDKTLELQENFIDFIHEQELPLHDHDRGGEKGFEYIGPGLTTTPRGRAMKKYFEGRNDPETAEKFHLSSMEYVRTLGGDPLCLVTEIPLFLVSFADKTRENRAGIPEAYLELKERLPLIRAKLERNESITKELKPFDIQHLPLSTAMKIQFRTIELGLETIGI